MTETKSNKAILKLTEKKLEEFNKCKESPYYFATKYLKINGKPFETNYTEEEFNELFFIMEGTKKYDKNCKRNF